MKIRDLYEKVELYGNDVQYKVLKKPSVQELLNFLEKSRRGMIKGLYDTTTKTLYVWDAFMATHVTAAYDMGIDDEDDNIVIPIVIGKNADGKIAYAGVGDNKNVPLQNNRTLSNIQFVAPDDHFSNRWV